MMTYRDKTSTIYEKLQSLSSDLGLLKGDYEDDNATEAAAEVEAAQDAVDGALQSLRAALQYSETEAA